MNILKTLAVLSLLGSAACVAAQDHAASAPAAVQADGVTIITLGTSGGPPPHVGRQQPATLLVVGGREYLIDAGEGAGYQLMQAGIQPSEPDVTFITHLHWDHTLGLDYLMASGWMRNRTREMPLFGPPGLSYFVSRQLASVEVGEAIFRAQAQQRPALASLYPVTDINSCDDHEVYRDDVVAVRAVCNSHFAEIASGAHGYGEDVALSYRFDTPHGSVTFTGDTGPSAELEALAAGSDVLVAEIVDLPSIGRALAYASGGSDITPLLTHMSHQHLTPEAVGQMATRAGVKTVILTHFVVGADFNVDELGPQVREHFAGEVLVGHDLQRFEIGSAD